MNDAAAREHKDTETDAAGHGLRVSFSGEGTGEGTTAAAYSSGGDIPTPAARRRLARLVAAKLLLDLLFVGAFALYTHAHTFRRSFDGALQHTDGRGARGWVVDLERPSEPVEVQLFVDGRFVASTFAEEPRTDTDDETSRGAGRRSFTFVFDRDLHGEHSVGVYAVRARRGGERRTLHLIGGARVSWK